MFPTRRQRELWTSAKALVYSVQWIEPTHDDYGHYDVVFSYRAAGELYTGTFTDYGKAAEDYLHKEDVIDILYDPDHPERNFYPRVRTATNRRLISFFIGIGIAIVVLLVSFLKKHFN